MTSPLLTAIITVPSQSRAQAIQYILWFGFYELNYHSGNVLTLFPATSVFLEEKRGLNKKNWQPCNWAPNYEVEKKPCLCSLYLVESFDSPDESIKIADATIDVFSRLDLLSPASICTPRITKFKKEKRIVKTAGGGKSIHYYSFVRILRAEKSLERTSCNGTYRDP